MARFQQSVSARRRFASSASLYHLPGDTHGPTAEEERGVAETREVADGLSVDLDADGCVLGFDIDHASKRFDLSALETKELPERQLSADPRESRAHWAGRRAAGSLGVDHYPGHVARFPVSSTISSRGFPDGFRGTIRVASESLVGVVAVRGRINERGDYLFMATPPLNEWAEASFFPHIAYGGGWTTQMVLFGQAGQASSGNILIRSQDGVQNTEFGEAP